MNLYTIYQCEADKKLLVQKLQSWKVIPEEGKYICSKCGEKLKLSKNKKYEEGYIWVCKNKIIDKTKSRLCEHKVTLRAGTFLDYSQLNICDILRFVILWVINANIYMVTSELGKSEGELADWYSFCREILYFAFLEKQEPLGGKDIMVEIDEWKFCHKFGNGGEIEERCVFGAYERGTGHVLFETVNLHGTDTLIPFIQKWIRPGSTVISEPREAYDCLSNLGYKHLKVNPSENFLDVVSGAHINSIKATWKSVKSCMNDPHIPGNLAKYIFYEQCIQQKINPVEEFLNLAGKLYNPMNQPNDSRPVFGKPEPGYDYMEDSSDETDRYSVYDRYFDYGWHDESD